MCEGFWVHATRRPALDCVITDRFHRRHRFRRCHPEGKLDLRRDEVHGGGVTRCHEEAVKRAVAKQGKQRATLFCSGFREVRRRAAAASTAAIASGGATPRANWISVVTRSTVVA